MPENRDSNNSRSDSSRGNNGAGSRHKRGRRGKRKADIVRPGPLYRMADAIVTLAAFALIGAIIVFVIMIFG